MKRREPEPFHLGHMGRDLYSCVDDGMLYPECGLWKEL